MPSSVSAVAAAAPETPEPLRTWILTTERSTGVGLGGTGVAVGVGLGGVPPRLIELKRSGF